MTATRTYTRRLSTLLDARPITRAERRRAARWYVDAGRQADQLAHVLDVDRTTGACILSAYSIRTPWADNVAHAWHYATAETPPPGLRARTVIADAALIHGLDALRGPKTRAFAQAIAGDRSAVVVDVWMCRAAGLDRDNPTARQYRAIAASIAVLARRHGLDPRAMQALIWGRVRGSLD